MHFFSWIAVAISLRFLPSCTASPVTLRANIKRQELTQEDMTEVCNHPNPYNMMPECWDKLGLDSWITSWTDATIIANAPAIGTMYCKPTEIWGQCFLRFAYGQQEEPKAAVNCATLASTQCVSPIETTVLKPTSAEGWYGTYAVYAVFTYIKNLSRALLSAAGEEGVMETAYVAANDGAGAASSAYPVDATLLYLLEWNNKTNMDDAFINYVQQNRMELSFPNANTDFPGIGPVYETLVLNLETRVEQLMLSWDEFSKALGANGTWIQRVPAHEELEQSWMTPMLASADKATGEIETS
ncbi:MAG: hypothetical protein Q9174_002678 [Haloplaca sp. 1 TL-2023]